MVESLYSLSAQKKLKVARGDLEKVKLEKIRLESRIKTLTQTETSLEAATASQCEIAQARNCVERSVGSQSAESTDAPASTVRLCQLDQEEEGLIEEAHSLAETDKQLKATQSQLQVMMSRF